MKKNLLKLSNLILFISLSLFSFAQPNWFYTNTGSNHTVLIQAGIPITINGVSFSNGDYVGVFYDSLGTLACAGYSVINGGTSALTVWGDDASTGDKDGFAANEAFNWKIWRASDGVVFNAVAYFSATFPSQGNYVGNGMSGLDSLIAVVGSNIAVGNLLSPISGCGTLTATETFSFQVLNIGTADVDSFEVSYSIDGGGSWVTEQVVQFLGAGSSYLFTSTATYDFSAMGAYQLGVSVYHPNDNSLSDNTLLFDINNAQAPVIDLSGLTTTYCADPVAIQLQGLPLGGEFSSPDILILNNDEAFFTIAGVQQVFYTYTDTNGCSATDSINFTINPVPDFNLGNLITSCEGEEEQIAISSGFTTYEWNTGATDTSIVISVSGVYSLAVTNSYGCTNIDSVEAIFNLVPTFEIQGNTDYCEGDFANLSAAGAGNSYIWNTGSYSDSIIVLTSGDYSVTVSSNGCLGYDTISVVFHTNPIPDLGADINICDGTTTDLDAGSYDTYLWGDGSTNQILTVGNAGDYIVTVTNVYGCEGSDIIEVTVDPLATAAFSFVIDNSIVSFTNESQNENAGTYEWDFGDGTTSTDENPSHTYAAEDTYVVTLVVGNDCGNDTISMNVTILDIEDLSGENIISVFPNPSNGSFVVELQNISSNNINISVVNTLGQEVFFLNNTTFENETRYELNLTNKPAGIYFLSIENKSWVYNKMIVIE